MLVLPEGDPTLGGHRPLLQLERAEFEAELGTSVELADADPGAGVRWLLLVDPARREAPSISLDRVAGLIVSRAADSDGILETLSLWRTVARSGGGTVTAADCEHLDEAIASVVAEVADTYPSFELRGLDWDAICARHTDRVRAAADPLPALQRWLAELEDAHTWVSTPIGNLPYAVRLDRRGATFVRVREGSAASSSGVEPGWRLVELDGAPPDVELWLARTAAPPGARPLLAGRRLLAGPVGRDRKLTAAAPSGARVTWREAPTGVPEDPLVSWRRLPSGSAYVRIEAWVAGRGVDDAFDAAFAELRGCRGLIVDLRGNPGGDLVLACRTRDRFLRERTELGSIRYSVGDGRLSDAFPIVGEPAPAEKCWNGRLVVLTDPLTFSASEDFLLGLQGLPHVHVVGTPTGGGSGRPRSLRLLPGWRLSVSTALTYDRSGRCIEGAGIPVDLEIDAPDDAALRAAELFSRPRSAPRFPRRHPLR